MKNLFLIFILMVSFNYAKAATLVNKYADGTSELKDITSVEFYKTSTAELVVIYTKTISCELPLSVLKEYGITLGELLLLIQNSTTVVYCKFSETANSPNSEAVSMGINVLLPRK